MRSLAGKWGILSAEYTQLHSFLYRTRSSSSGAHAHAQTEVSESAKCINFHLTVSDILQSSKYCQYLCFCCFFFWPLRLLLLLVLLCQIAKVKAGKRATLTLSKQKTPATNLAADSGSQRASERVGVSDWSVGDIFSKHLRRLSYLRWLSSHRQKEGHTKSLAYSSDDSGFFCRCPRSFKEQLWGKCRAGK